MVRYEIVEALKDSSFGFRVPSNAWSRSVVEDNSAGTADIVKPLPTPGGGNRYIVILKVDSSSSSFYIGNSNSQEFLLEPGDMITFTIDALTKVYYKVPVGAVAKFYLFAVY